MRALLIEDDPDVWPEVARALEEAGFIVDLAIDGEEAWYKGDVEDYDVAILDIGLPRLDGLSVLARWRASARSLPVLILSARGEWTEKVKGMEAGADDYLAKPFAMGELVTRVRTLVRRTAGHASPLLIVGDLTIDTRRMSASIDGQRLQLTKLEFRLLNYLAHQRDRAVPPSELAEHLYGVNEPGDFNTVEAIVLRLRRKIGADRIETKRGFGYMLMACK
jgi:DNA-binding response OmpR family regulator